MQKTTGIHSLLSVPLIYNIVQRAFLHQKTHDLIKKHLDIGAKAVVLDIGCGVGNAIKLLNPDYEYYGYDISAEYISQAADKFEDRPGTTFINDKFNEETSKSLPEVDLALLMGVMHHISDQELTDLLTCISKQLKTGGFLMTVDPVRFKGQNFLASALVSVDRGKAVRSSDGYLGLLSEQFRVIHSHTIGQRFPPYDRFISFSTSR